MKEVKFEAGWFIGGREEILNASNLTENEVKVMIGARNNDYNDPIESSSATYSFAVCEASGLDEKVYRGVVSSLIKKGYVVIAEEGGDVYFYFTEEGEQLFRVA